MTFWRIQLPLILPTVGIVAILTYAASMNAFDLIFALQSPIAAPNYATPLLRPRDHNFDSVRLGWDCAIDAEFGIDEHDLGAARGVYRRGHTAHPFHHDPIHASDPNRA
jgi:hypothetical protein